MLFTKWIEQYFLVYKNNNTKKLNIKTDTDTSNCSLF